MSSDEQFKGDACAVRLSSEVLGKLEEHKKRSKAAAKDVMKVGAILEQLSIRGVRGMNNREQFRHEGKFTVGKAGSADCAVYAIKSFNLRIYGGFVDGTFHAVEMDVKKKDKADPAVLQRAARKLGELQ